MFLRRLISGQDGVSAVEFGLLAIPFLTLVLGGIDLGHQAFIKSQLQGSLADAARKASVEKPVFFGSSTTVEDSVLQGIKQAIAPVAPNAAVGLKVSNFYDFSGVGNPEKLITDVDGDGIYDDSDGDCFEDLNENAVFDLDSGRAGAGGANDVVFYDATLTMPRLTPMAGLLGWPKNMVVKASIATRSQPFGIQKTPPIVCGTVI